MQQAYEGTGQKGRSNNMNMYSSYLVTNFVLLVNNQQLKRKEMGFFNLPRDTLIIS